MGLRILSLKLDIDTNRKAKKWTKSVQIARVLWALCWPLFAFIPRPFWVWRRVLLRLFGAKIGRRVHIYPSVKVTMPWNISIADDTAIGDRAILYALGSIEIGERVTISQGAHLCAGSHDISRPDRPLVMPPITIGDDTWIAADAFIGPKVCVGSASIVGARAVVMNDISDFVIVAGNPAQVLKQRNQVKN